MEESLAAIKEAKPTWYKKKDHKPEYKGLVTAKLEGVETVLQSIRDDITNKSTVVINTPNPEDTHVIHGN